MGFIRWIRRVPTVLAERWKKNKWLLVYEVFNVIFNWPVYGWLLYTWGFNGALAAAAFSLVQNATMFSWYDRYGIDWMSADELRSLEKQENLKWYERALVWFGKEKKSGASKFWSRIVFTLAVTQFDPLIVAIHYQKRHFQGLGFKDWFILYYAVILANGLHILQLWIGIEFAEFLWNHWDTIGPVLYDYLEVAARWVWGATNSVFGHIINLLLWQQ